MEEAEDVNHAVVILGDGEQMVARIPWAELTVQSLVSDDLSRVFSALADPTRREIVARLAVGDATVMELAAPFAVSKQAVSKHLRVLEVAGLVSRAGDAHRRPVHLEAEVFDLMTKWIDRYRGQAEDRFQRLDRLLADMDSADGPGSAETAPTETRRSGTVVRGAIRANPTGHAR